MTAQHTPLPWETVGGPTSDDLAICEAGGGDEIAIITNASLADRDLIVRAVNSHGVLRDALREMVAVFGSDDPGMRGPVEQMARAALAKAGEA